VIAYVARTAPRSSFDAVASGVADGDHERVAPFEEVGATWWMESDDGYPGWEGRVLERVRGGPPA
jgi:hypothetical protein